MFDDVVTPPLGVLRICVAVLRDVTVLAIAPPSLSYELTGRGLPDCGRSHTFRSTAFHRSYCFTTSHLFAPNSPRSVPKSVPNTANTRFKNLPQGPGRIVGFQHRPGPGHRHALRRTRPQWASGAGGISPPAPTSPSTLRARHERHLAHITAGSRRLRTRSPRHRGLGPSTAQPVDLAS